MSQSPALEVKNITKVYGNQTVVNDLSLQVPRGSIYGLVGPNGAGKTTMIGMATGLIRPTVGEAFICGYDVWNNPQPAKQAMGLLVDGLPVFDRLTGSELLEYVGALHHLQPDIVQQRTDELLDALGLADARNKMVVDYSAGMTKKILLATALLHKPEVLILDEPLEAVDPVSGQIIQKILRAFAASGGTVVLSSHVMSLVEGLCDHVAIIDHGNVVAFGHVDEVRQGRALTEVFVELVGGGDLAEGSLEWLGQAEDESTTTS
ncbi:ABC transporter ATP-binding protein [Corynebacterium freiburgense]|uniref:ABC transporter ATP-binding protein n=1 Tax=Corynebacterium freiburgense TaxID=556548 RepID=UPI0003F88143|nr:ABC transporter ATP-binding protein [Corynebacterium freiburgense]WJZ03015.1 Daunorubicin/doxorubicin resistance ATP-binding protein DrrA [Corynebacterium freiburgense]